ncbi:hypothetical protein BKA56DRAFT_612617 [Ilyonectria sp. MPI-CAGE-AT-0026]|nr:hypothetical protein BKA56DRAFT_612617 [Ilyonectria sp. MPI-CAGE-AT-0026]
MCKFVRATFECRHHQRVDAVMKCSNPLNCVGGNLFWQIKNRDINNIDSSMFRDFPMEGVDCRECSAVVTEADSRKQEDVRPIDAIAQLVASFDNRSNPTKSNRQRLRQNSQSLPSSRDEKLTCPPIQSPRDVCGSGTCMKRVVVTPGGRKGEFCSNHTCEATDVNCLMDTYTPIFPRQLSHFCQNHTCVYHGCGARALGLGGNLCEDHRVARRTKEPQRNLSFRERAELAG